MRRARSSARMTGRTNAKVQAAKEYVRRNQGKCVDVASLTYSVTEFPTKVAPKRIVTQKEEESRKRIQVIHASPTSSIASDVSALIALSSKAPKTIASPATLAEMASLLSSASDADTEAALSSFSADVMSKLSGALEREETSGEKEHTLTEIVTLLSFADAAETENALASFTPSVMAKLTEALGSEVDTTVPTVTEMTALLASANADDTEAALGSCSAAAIAKLTKAIDEAKVDTKPTSVTEMIALLSSANAADTEVALASCSAGAMEKLTLALGETKVAVEATTLTEMVALLASANAAETEAAIASFNPDVKAKLAGALQRPPGDFRSLSRSGWGGIHALFPRREPAGSRTACVEQPSSSLIETEVSPRADERLGDAEMKTEK